MDNVKQDILSNNLLSELYVNFLNYSETDELIIFESRFSTFYKKPIVYIDDKIIAGFSQLKPEDLQVLKKRFIYNKKLQEIADETHISRERVRQIEDQSIRKFLITVDRSIMINISDQLSMNPILFLEDLPIKDNELKLLFCAILSYKKSRKALFDHDIMALVQNSKYSFTGILNKIEGVLEQSEKKIFSKNDLIYFLESIFPLINRIDRLIPILLQKEMIEQISNDEYFFSFPYSTKRSMVELVFSLYEHGIELNKDFETLENELMRLFPKDFKGNDKKRAITGLAGYSDKILLWEWGRYLHTKYIYPILEEYDFSSILDYIDAHLNDTQIDLESCFKAHENELVNIGITGKYALHTSLKLKYPEDYSYQDSPWISKAGTERRELRQTLRNLMIENRNYSLNELVDLLHTNKTRLQQLIDNTDDIIQVDAFQYKKKEFIAFSPVLLDDIIQYANKKVKELDFIYIELIEDEFKNKLSQYSQYDIRILILELLKKYPNEKEFNVSNTRIINKDYPLTKDSLNFHILIEELLKDKNIITINEIANYFVKRGLAQNRIMMYYYTSKLKRIVRLDKETFTSMEKIGLTQKNIEKINLLLENSLTDEIHIDDILMNYKLPVISLDWNRFILTDLTDHGKFVFSPSRENPIYIAKKEFNE